MVTTRSGNRVAASPGPPRPHRVRKVKDEKAPTAAGKTKTKTKSRNTSTKSTRGTKSKIGKSQSHNSVSSTSFFNLPAEIRNRIYTLALPLHDQVSVGHNRPFVREPGALAVSRQFRSEALPIFYGNNIFVVGGSSPCTRFLRSLPDSVLRCMRSVRIRDFSSGSVEISTAAWLKYVRGKLEQLQREPSRRGLRHGVIRFPLIVDEYLFWAGADELDDITVLDDDQLTLIPADSDDGECVTDTEH